MNCPITRIFVVGTTGNGCLGFSLVLVALARTLSTSSSYPTFSRASLYVPRFFATGFSVRSNCTKVGSTAACCSGQNQQMSFGMVSAALRFASAVVGPFAGTSGGAFDFNGQARQVVRHDHSIPFSFHPFANVWSAVFKFRAIRSTTHKEAHYFAIDHADVFQIYNEVSVIRLKLKKPSQLGYRRFFDPATQGEHCESPSCLSLNPESHRQAHLANSAVAALCWTYLFHPGTVTSNATERPTGFH